LRLILLTFLFLSNLTYAKGLNLSHLEVGDIIAVSDFQVATAFLQQAGAGSSLDHVGLVVEGEEGKMIYQFFKGNHEIVSFDQFRKMFQRPNGTLYYTHGRLKTGLPKELRTKFAAAVQEAKNDRLGLTDGTREKFGSCPQLIKFIFSKIGITVGSFSTVADYNTGAFKGFVYKIWEQMIPAREELVMTHSLFEGNVKIVSEHLWAPRSQISPDRVLLEWAKEGKLDKVAQLYDISLLKDDHTAALVRADRKLDPSIRTKNSIARFLAYVAPPTESCLRTSLDVLHRSSVLLSPQ